MPEIKEEKPKKDKKKIKVYTNKSKNKRDVESVIDNLKSKYESINAEEITKFCDFPLSSNTLKALRECGYHKPTEIQRETIGLALQGKDILGAAQTGSGKTLAFLIPLLEKLYTLKWTKMDGVGSIVITPTRELAYQIFETLRKIGQHHDFSAGLIIGGKDLKFERNRMDQCNIIICTPGRLLQHMDENPLFDCVNMQILVLDEADRCLDMGFEQTMNAIIENLPPKRQTLLFSATQTRSVRDLARLSLKDPSYISVHENLEHSTPKGLSQSYVVCELKDKVSVLWSFLKNHPNKKIMVFFASCKQVKYVYEIFCKLRPGTPLLALYGTLHQLRRMDIYENFCHKQSAILFSTDLAARGLDFPAVHWVLQVDCPEDPATYIHRVGRTARYHRGGESLLMLLESEIQMVDKLKEKKIPIQKIEINPMKLNNPVRKMEAFLAKDPTLKDTAQRAFVSYAKAVYLMKDKEVFDVHALDTDSFARSLGLAIPPRIRFLQRMHAMLESKQQKKEVGRSSNNKKYFKDSEDEGVSNNFEDSGVSKPKYIPKEPSKSSQSGHFQTVENDSEDDDILTVKRKDHDIDLPSQEEIAELDMGRISKKKALSKAAMAKKILKKKIVPNKKILFNEEGEAVTSGKTKKSELALQYENENEGGIDIEKAKQVLKEEDKFDKQLFKEKVKAKHKEQKRKLKEQKKKEREDKDDFGTSESEEEPDLSWLPDPDKVYNNENEEINEEEGETDRESSPNKKQKLRNKKKNKKNTNFNADSPESGPKRKRKKLEKLTLNMDVNEAEELALMLLNKKT
ncbi:unnamed protein product [Acanthoscelides obtectus]|uniref:ATP-dependent RNA helicase n=1 Tax=Acanthoscelides obtectus TaxID=200917 RepID=A0A9P0M183_ACAOB|nr:unnamed protein product [Acanthoscelides obtectus]CAK1632805.1 Probable ATP-dependent RNA helicase DDX10 [Acanthoscelides obtectus]